MLEVEEERPRRFPKIIPCYTKVDQQQPHCANNPRAYWNAMFVRPIPMTIIYDLLQSCGSANIIIDSRPYVVVTHTDYRIMLFHKWIDIFASEVGNFYSDSFKDADNVAPHTFTWWLTTITRICRYNECTVIRDKPRQRNMPPKLYIQHR